MANNCLQCSKELYASKVGKASLGEDKLKCFTTFQMDLSQIQTCLNKQCAEETLTVDQVKTLLVESVALFKKVRDELTKSK